CARYSGAAVYYFDYW
nr:immunoglobulin heavy chain junction region [Macaca mulatta]